MMKMFRAAALTVLLATASAAQAQQTCSPTVPEPFAGFLQRFSVDKTFATERTVLPLAVLAWGGAASDMPGVESGPVKTYVSPRTYAGQPLIGAQLKVPGWKSLLQLQNRRRAVLKVFKDDTDMQVEYMFRNQGGCWYLWQLEDHSL